MNKTGKQENYGDVKNMIGDQLSFEATEAYKRLRTNLLFSFAGEDKCRIVGVTSSLRDEGKSTTSANLSYSLAEMGKRVLLIDADMRRPNVHTLLDLQLSPGLSNLLVGVDDGVKLIQAAGIQKNLHVMTAGDISPNPTELLSSKRMEGTIKLLSERYDFIIIDLPPVGAVADALIVSKYMDGMVVVVRNSYVDKRTLDKTINQLRYHEVRIVGFVLNAAKSEGKYYSKRYEKKGAKYGYGPQ